MKKLYLLALLALLVLPAACTEVNEYVQGDLRQPAELTPITAATVKARLAWSVQLEPFDEFHDFKLRPAVDDDVVYVAESRGRVAAHKNRNGDLMWDRLYDAGFSAGITLGSSMVVLGTDGAEVWALSRNNGDVLWKAQISSELLSPPLVQDTMVVVHTGDDKLIGINAATGTRVWVSSHSLPSLSLRGTSAPVLWNDAVIAGLANGKIVAVNVFNGKMLWETTLGAARGRTELERLVDLDGRAAVVDDVLYITGYQGKTAALNLQNGQIIWARDLSSFSDVAVHANMVLLHDEFSRVWALDRASGATMWQQDDLHGRKLTSPVVQEQYLVVGDFAGYLHWIRLSDGKIAGRARMKQAENRARVLGAVEYPEEDPLHKYVDITGVPVEPFIDRDRLYVTDRSGVLAVYRFSAVN